MDLQQEKKLFEKCKTDPANFSQFYKEYSKDVYRYSYALLNSKEDAEEITSETFMIGYKRISQLQFINITIKAWLYTVARHLIYSKFRKSKEISADTVIEEYPSDEKNIQDLDPQLETDIQELLLDLPIITREIIILKIWEEYKFTEIGEMIGKDESAVKQQYYRGLDKLKQKLHEKGYDKNYLVLPILIGGIDTLKNSGTFEMTSALAGAIQAKLLASHSNLFSQVITNMVAKKILYGVLGTIAVAGISTVGYIYLKPSFNPATPPSNTLTPTSVEEQDNNDIVWVRYSNTELPDVTFEYPQGSEVNTDIHNDPSTVCIDNECWKITVEYKDMKFTIDKIAGIGGVSAQLTGDYTEIYSGAVNTSMNGIIRSVESTEPDALVYYSLYCNSEGAKWIPVQDTSLSYTVTKGKEQAYYPISDRMVLSFFQLHTTTAFPAGSNTDTSTEAYGTYQDDYIKFMYPKGSSLTVESGKIKNNFADIEGMLSIDVENLIRIYAIKSGGISTYVYAEPNTLRIGEHTGTFTTYTLANKPYMYELSNGLYLFGLNGEDATNSIYFYNNKPAFLMDKQNDGTYTITNPIANSLGFNFMAGTGSLLGYDASTIENRDVTIKCTYSNINDFNACGEKLSKFFETVVRVD